MRGLKVFFFFTLLTGALHVSAETTPKLDKAIFAAGCFWCIQPPYDELKGKGVVSTEVGYTGGTSKNPTYAQVSEGSSGHIEAIQVTFDPQKISYEKLLQIFWRNIDPYDEAGQFCDKGPQYVSAVFYVNEDQKKVYEKVLQQLKKEKLKDKVATKLLEAKPFYPAEDYHQSYYTKNPVRYKFYRYNCGRDKRLKEVWGEASVH